MELTKSVLCYEKVETKNEPIPVIIVAAGSSVRMQGKNKQFLLINGVPVIAKTIMKFQNNNLIKSIIVVTKEEDILNIQSLCEEYKLTKVSDIVAGGNTRSESVKCGMARLDKADKKVLIHDGARPFVTDAMISDVVKALKTADCAIIAKQATDTVKQTDKERTVKCSLDRDSIYLAQTPQGVNVNKYRFALNSLDAEKYTDDCSLMEAMGYKCVVCKGSTFNMKVTFPEDIIIAEHFAQILEENP